MRAISRIFSFFLDYSYLFLSFTVCLCVMYNISITMTKKQRENTAKYLYDISKGIALLAIIGNFVSKKWDMSVIVFGGIATVAFFTWAYILDGDNKNE
ncbi:MAG: hypothetical protein E3K32_05135 [wastewater metagenome]|nr:hypothetical protein [Candidatus Loosdrechtia aerotolerans]